MLCTQGSAAPMDTIATPQRWATPRAAEAVALSRPQVVALALLTCVPIPLLSLAAMVVPLPQILERAAATFVPFVAPTLGDDEGRVARESASAVRALGIVHRPSEQSVSSLAQRAGPTRVGGGTRAGPSAPDPSLAPDGGPTTQPSEGAPDSTPPSGTGEQGESPPSGADPTAPPAGGPPGDAPGGGNTDGQGAPNGSGGTPPGDAPGQASDHGKPGSPLGQGDPGPPSDPGGRNSGGSVNSSGQGAPPTSEPPTGGGASPGAGGRRP